ncbi:MULTISPECIES: plasmid mobilization relaxosome protein MobC [unclassified Gemella]|uniref:plasmid mobilization protein n=1 Tax=unclassified Gemella TaxID=2624949 RepID=UPI001C0418AF|nr:MULTISPECIES: plasmid mobilization relaxosome protein MobC [unclassified Gemella]MBU0279134.1 plasmid mobilization relaxosome protein MobC [Gemella sp. zg-1178]QWQ38611.1 plasmid mobilization relaxosome protein MobC [Gemella sp. zg-570]
MANRTRKIQLKICLTDKEKELFEEKRRLSKCSSMASFIRKSILEKEIIVIDLEPFYKIQHLLSNATNNINQIAKYTNTYGVIYKTDIEDMKQMISKTSKNVLDILSYLQNTNKINVEE